MQLPASFAGFSRSFSNHCRSLVSNAQRNYNRHLSPTGNRRLPNLPTNFSRKQPRHLAVSRQVEEFAHCYDHGREAGKLPPHLQKSESETFEQYYESLRPYEKHRLRVSRRRHIKRLRQSPSEDLIEALKLAGTSDLLPAVLPRWKRDLSYISPGNARSLSRARGVKRPPLSPRTRKRLNIADEEMISLQSITAKFIRWELQKGERSWEKPDPDNFGTLAFEMPESEAEPGVLTAEETNFLQQRNYEASDARFWAIVLLEPHDVRAADALISSSITVKGEHIASTSPSPRFVLNFMLRRKAISVAALQTFLVYAWQLLLRRRHEHLDITVTFLLFIRLVRHARVVWPAGIVNITALLSAQLFLRDQIAHVSGRIIYNVKIAALTRLCNRALSLLAFPTSLNPTKSAIYQQRAQFDFIRQMVAHRPSLLVNRLGYSSVVSVLLRLKKTDEERDWASLKAKSWPPFKQSKTRLDDEKDPDYGLSRTAQAIKIMQEYGYSMQSSDVVYRTLSGWHPDGTPMIQTRALRKHRRSGSDINPSHKKQQERYEYRNLVGALIEATRTVEEAWACFLAYKSEQPGLKGYGFHPYQAMFKKLACKHKNIGMRELWNDATFENLPGDGLESVPAPEDPTEAIYIPTPPPSFDELYNQMIHDGIQPGQSLVQCLVEYAPNLELGLRYWKAHWGRIPGSIVVPKQGLPKVVSVDEELANNRRLLALVRLLGRQSMASSSTLIRIVQKDVALIEHWFYRPADPIIYTFLLLFHNKPSYRPVWNTLLKSLANPDRVSEASYYLLHDKFHSSRILSMTLARRTLQLMEELNLSLDCDGFASVCQCVEETARALIPSQETLVRLFVEPTFRGQWNKATMVSWVRCWDPPRRLREMFAKLVGMNAAVVPKIPDSASRQLEGLTISAIPQHLDLPDPAQLHHYARALGMFGDHEGLLSLVKWMVSVKDDLATAADAAINGKARFRRLLVALRVFLECPNQDGKARDSRNRRVLVPANPEVVALVKQEVESVRDWGGWPNDYEVNWYCRAARGYEVTRYLAC